MTVNSSTEHLEAVNHAHALDWVKEQVKRKPARCLIYMQDFAAWLSCDQGLPPFEPAAEAHYRLVTIHLFADGNAHGARLLMNMILLMNGYPAAVIRKRDRLAYIGSLEKAQLGGS